MKDLMRLEDRIKRQGQKSVDAIVLMNDLDPSLQSWPQSYERVQGLWELLT